MSTHRTDTEVVFLNDTGIVGDFKRSKRYAVGSERFVTLLVICGTGVPVGMKFRAFATIKTLNNDGYNPVDADSVIDSNNAYAPVGIMDLNDRIFYKGSDGLPIQAGKNGLFQVMTEGVDDLFFEIEGSGVPVTIIKKAYNF